MNLSGVKHCLDADSTSIHQTDLNRNNAMHLCVGGSAEIRARELMIFLLEKTEIDLLHKNDFGFNPLNLAYALNDVEAIELLESYSHQQLNEKYPLESELSIVPPKPKDPPPTIS